MKHHEHDRPVERLVALAGNFGDGVNVERGSLTPAPFAAPVPGESFGGGGGGGRPDRIGLTGQLRTLAGGGEYQLGGCWRLAVGVELPEVGGERGIVERPAGEVGIEAAERGTVGAGSVRADAISDQVRSGFGDDRQAGAGGVDRGGHGLSPWNAERTLTALYGKRRSEPW